MDTPNTLRQLTEHVCWYTPDARTDRPSLAAASGRRGTLLLDIGASPAHTGGFLRALAEHGVPPLRYAALTHWHWDHSFGAAALDVPIIAHEETARQLAVQASYDWSDAALDQRVEAGQELAFCRDMLKLELPDRSGLKLALPDILLTHRLTIDLGDVQCQLIHVGGDHAPDSVAMYIPQDRVLFLGDALYDAIYAPKRHYTLARSRALLDCIEPLDVQHCITGHHTQALSGQELRAWTGSLRTVGNLIEQHGSQRETIIQAYETATGHPPDADELADIDAFLAGLDPSQAD